MSKENVQIVRRSFEAFNERDLDGYLALMDDDVEIVPRILGGLGSSLRGHAEVCRWWKDLLDFIPDVKVEPVEIRELGEVMVVHCRYRGHGATSDAPVAEMTWMAWRWRNGKCAWWSSHATEAQALEAAGLRE
jgi:ketosteroid isomerase-like protein